MNATIRAVSVDLDGTLYDLRRAKGPLLWATFPRWRTMRVGRAVREELRGQSFVDGAALLAEEARVVAERLETDAAAARVALDAIFTTKLTAVLRTIGPIAGVKAALSSMAARGLKLALVSDRGAARAKLAALGLDDLPWSAVVSADDTGVLKPSPDVLQHTARLLGVEPVELLHVGDRDDADGAAARAAGCACVIIDPHHPTPFDAVLRALSAVDETSPPKAHR